MRFTLTIDSENDALVEAPEEEITTMLAATSVMVNVGRRSGILHDTNGNDVGEWELTD